MKYLYLWLDLITLFFPVVLSFDKRVHFFSSWKNVSIATVIIAVPYMMWDTFFTNRGVWGFNPAYLSGINVGSLPLEEVMFFFVVPFACVFIYACVKHYFAKISFTRLDSSLKIILFLYIITLIFINPNGWYTMSATLSAAAVVVLWNRNKSLRFVGISYLICLIPFVVVNGILTGGVTEEPIVWYNDLHNCSVRFWSIPLEDFIYAFGHLVSVILLYEFLQARKRS